MVKLKFIITDISPALKYLTTFTKPCYHMMFVGAGLFNVVEVQSSTYLQSRVELFEGQNGIEITIISK